MDYDAARGVASAARQREEEDRREGASAGLATDRQTHSFWSSASAALPGQSFS